MLKSLAKTPRVYSGSKQMKSRHWGKRINKLKTYLQKPDVANRNNLPMAVQQLIGVLHQLSDCGFHSPTGHLSN